MDTVTEPTWRAALRIAAIGGIVLLYIGLVGMLGDFNEREVVRDAFTMAQLLIALTPFMAATIMVHRLRSRGTAVLEAVAYALVSGLIVALPTLIMLYISNVTSIDDILVNVGRDWIEAVTFDNRSEQLLGAAIFTGVVLVASLAGAALQFLPQAIRRALIYGTSFTLLVGVFGETVNLILEQLLPEDAIDALFRRDTLLLGPAIGLLLLSNAGTLLWAFSSNFVVSNYSALPEQNKSLLRIGVGVAGALLLLLLPSIVGRALSDVAVQVGLFVLMGFGLNIAIGLAGLLDLGYVTNYAVGAYIMAVFTTTGVLGIGPDWLSFWLVIPIALLAAMFAGFIFAVPVLKMRGDYLAIATLGFGEIIGKLAISDWLAPIIGGAQGIQSVPKPELFGTTLSNPEQLYYIVLVACVITLFVSVRLNNSRTGRQWMAIREDEDVAAAMGINVARAKLLAFTLSAATGGVAGAIFAVKVGTVFPTSFTVFVSINVLSLIIVGGMGSNPGIFLGAIALIGMPELLREFSEYRFLLYGILLIFMMVNRPEGLFPSQVRRREIISEEKRKAGPAVSAGGAGD